MELSYEDMQQLYVKSIVLYKGKPVFIEACGPNGEVLYRDLATQRTHQVKFALKNFTSPTKRLGFINTQGSVVYAMRLPLRRFKVGIGRDNTQLSYVPGASYPLGELNTIDHVSDFRSPEFVDALEGSYPALDECVKHLREFKGAMAFDRQFALNDNGSIYYRTKKVGKLVKKDKGVYTAKDIEFDDSNKHLFILLEGNHEKDLSAIR